MPRYRIRMLPRCWWSIRKASSAISLPAEPGGQRHGAGVIERGRDRIAAFKAVGDEGDASPRHEVVDIRRRALQAAHHVHGEGRARIYLFYARLAFCRAKTSWPSRSRIRTPIVWGGHFIFAAAMMAAGASATWICFSVKFVGPRSTVPQTNWIRNIRGCSKTIRVGESSSGRGGEIAASSPAGPRVRRATTKATRLQSPARSSRLASRSRRRASA